MSFITQATHYSYAHLFDPTIYMDGLYYLCKIESSLSDHSFVRFYAGRDFNQSLPIMKGC